METHRSEKGHTPRVKLLAISLNAMPYFDRKRGYDGNSRNRPSMAAFGSYADAAVFLRDEVIQCAFSSPVIKLHCATLPAVVCLKSRSQL